MIRYNEIWVLPALTNHIIGNWDGQGHNDDGGDGGDESHKYLSIYSGQHYTFLYIFNILSQTFKFDNIELGWKLSIPKLMSINLVLQNPELTKAETNDPQAASYPNPT